MIAIVPPPDLATRIHNERLNFAEEFGCVRALKPPVHITLFEPFKDDTPVEDDLQPLHKWAEKQQPFTIELSNYNFFDSNPKSPVVYIDVVRSDAIVQLHSALVKELKKYVETEPNRNKYMPHFTIGYRDIPWELFPSIRQRYSRSRFSGSFVCDAFHLWKHDGKQWQTVQTYPMKGTAELQMQASLF